MDHDRTQRSPRLVLDESINFNSLKILLRGGLDQRCSRVYWSWCAEKTRDGQLMKKRESDALADMRKQQEAAFVRIKTRIMRWLAEQAVAQYPCVSDRVSMRKLMARCRSLTEEMVLASIPEGSSEQGVMTDDLRKSLQIQYCLFSYLLDYLQTEKVHALVVGNLRQVNDDPKSRFCTLKRRFCQHYGLFGNEIVQRMISILGTHGDYETELAQVVEGNEDEERPSAWTKFRSAELLTSRLRFDKSSKAMRNEYQLVQKDDTTFLTEIRTIVTEEPAYRQIVEEILQEAANNLGVKLKKLEKEVLQLVGKEIARITKQETDERINAEKQDAGQAAEAQLCSLIRAALDAETDHPTNRLVFTTS